MINDYDKEIETLEKKKIKKDEKQKLEILKKRREQQIYLENHFLRERTIPNSIPSRNKIWGSIIFKDGHMTKTDETFDGKPFLEKTKQFQILKIKGN